VFGCFKPKRMQAPLPAIADITTLNKNKKNVWAEQLP